MDAVEDVKSRLAIEDVIGEYIELKRSGRNFKGLSPFTSEKTASFMVSPEKQIWHDFSSGKGGNMFSFVMEMEGLEFKGALELLARKAGVDLSQYRGGDPARGKQKERLHEALELAAKFYQVHFSKSRTALEYVFTQRGYSKETALNFRLGYSPNTGGALVTFMKQKGFTATEIKQAGLSNQRGSDMFRGRLMVPLMDPVGQVIGFTARLLEDDPKAPKYINTPQTLLYDKGRHIFGLHLAKEGIRKAAYAVLVEGNLDVIAAHQAGTAQTVATAGTALTEAQLKGLRRFTEDVRLCFDEDKAGVAATERAIPIAAKVGVNLSIIKLPSGKDPDELIRQDAKKWETAITKPTYVLDWLIDEYQQRLDLTSALGKRQFSDVLIKTIRQLPDSVEQDHYLNKIAELIGVSKSSLETKLTRGGQAEFAQPRRHATPPQTSRQAADHIKTQNHLLAVCLLRPDLRDNLKPVEADMLVDAPAQDLLIFLKENKDMSPELISSQLSMGSQADGVQGSNENRASRTNGTVSETRRQLTPQSAASADGVAGSAGQRVSTLRVHGDYVKMLALLFEELYQDLETLELRYEAARLKARLITQYVITQKQRLAEAMRQSRPSEAETMLSEVKKLDELLNDATKEIANAQ